MDAGKEDKKQGTSELVQTPMPSGRVERSEYHSRESRPAFWHFITAERDGYILRPQDAKLATILHTVVGV
jgi:hypothetical protein